MSCSVLPNISKNETKINSIIGRKEDVSTVPTSSSLPANGFADKTDYDSVSLATTCCSYGDISCYVVNNNTQSPIHCMDNFATTSADIENICVQNSTDVTFGSKTFFNGPIVITNFIANNEEQNSNSPSNMSERQESKQLTTQRKVHSSQRRSLLIGSILSAVVALVIIVLVPVYFLKIRENHIPVSNDIEDDYRFINRSQYGAEPSKTELESLLFPLPLILIARTPTLNCTTYDRCVDIVLRLQYLHMNLAHLDDIGMNFLVGGDGSVYEGRGYTVNPNTKIKQTIIIAFIGQFTEHEAPQNQLNAAQKFIESGVRSNEIDRNYLLSAHPNLISYPDNLLYKQVTLMKNWLPH